MSSLFLFLYCESQEIQNTRKMPQKLSLIFGYGSGAMLSMQVSYIFTYLHLVSWRFALHTLAVLFAFYFFQPLLPPMKFLKKFCSALVSLDFLFFTFLALHFMGFGIIYMCYLYHLSIFCCQARFREPVRP